MTTASAWPHPVVIHGFDDARLALDAAERLAIGSITLLSAPDAAGFMGAAWWRALIVLAANLHPVILRQDLLDCGDAAGRAMEALRQGQRGLILSPECPQYAAIVERAGVLGAAVLPERPPGLDLSERDALRKLDRWLTESDTHT